MRASASNRLRGARGAAVAAAACAITLGACSGGSGGGTTVLHVSGSTTVNPVAADAAQFLSGRGMKITVDTQGGSAGGLAQLAAGQIEVAMSSKPVGDEERSKHAGFPFVQTQVGADAVAIVVRREVVDGGVTTLTKDQLRGIFEGKIRNWKEVGGPDLDIFVYDKEPGRGTREVLDKYLYGPGGAAPAPPQSDRYAIVGGNEETRAKLLSTPGSVGPLSSSFITDYPKLAFVLVDGVAPTPENIINNTYPMARPLFLVTKGEAQGPAKRFIDYVLSPDGQALVTKHGYITLAQLGKQ